MIVGHGMMARAFAAFESDAGTLIFASGVSNSLETDPAAFRRERELLERTRAAHPGVLIVYFGTCSVHDPDRRDTPYVRHKLAMEALLERLGGPWLVLRLPLAIGPAHRSPTLAQFLYDRISRGESFEVWANAFRFPVDVDDARRIAERVIADRRLWNRRIDVALRGYPVSEFVRVMEVLVGRPARCAYVQKGERYGFECPEVAQLAGELGLDFSERYLERVLRKYFAPDPARADQLRP
jgi:nucleoside-diphosphate-sugar epimerase